jgi:hypothetical protein
VGSELDVDPYEPALDALMAAGLFPPLNGYRAEQAGDGQDVGVLEYRGTLSTDHRERISQIMGQLPYILDEVAWSADDRTVRRVADGRVLGSPSYVRRSKPNS